MGVENHVEYDIGADEPVSTAVVRAVSAVEGRKPRSLRPLADVLDPAALDALFDSRYDDTPRTGGRVEFVYSNCRITIDHSEYLTLQLLETRFYDTSEREPSYNSVR